MIGIAWLAALLGGKAAAASAAGGAAVGPMAAGAPAAAGAGAFGGAAPPASLPAASGSQVIGGFTGQTLPALQSAGQAAARPGLMDMMLQEYGIKPSPGDDRGIAERMAESADRRQGMRDTSILSRPLPRSNPPEDPLSGAGPAPRSRRGPIGRQRPTALPMRRRMETQGIHLGRYQDGGRFRVPLLPPGMLDAGGHHTFRMDLAPGEEVEVKPAPGASRGGDGGGGAGPRPLVTAEELRRAGDPDMGEAWRAALLSGSISGLGRNLEQQRARGGYERYQEIVGDYLGRAQGRRFTPVELEKLAFLREYHTGERGGFTPQQARTEYKGTQMRVIAPDGTPGEWVPRWQPRQSAPFSRDALLDAENAMMRREEFFSLPEPELQMMYEAASGKGLSPMDAGRNAIFARELADYERAFEKTALDAENPERWKEQRERYRRIKRKYQGRVKDDPPPPGGDDFESEASRIARRKAEEKLFGIEKKQSGGFFEETFGRPAPGFISWPARILSGDIPPPPWSDRYKAEERDSLSRERATESLWRGFRDPGEVRPRPSAGPMPEIPGGGPMTEAGRDSLSVTDWMRGVSRRMREERPRDWRERLATDPLSGTPTGIPAMAESIRDASSSAREVADAVRSSLEQLANDRSERAAARRERIEKILRGDLSLEEILEGRSQRARERRKRILKILGVE